MRISKEQAETELAHIREELESQEKAYAELSKNIEALASRARSEKDKQDAQSARKKLAKAYAVHQKNIVTLQMLEQKIEAMDDLYE